MTYIHPNNHKSLLNLVIAGLAIFTVVGIFSLIALYNNIVDLNHSIASTKTELDSVGAKSTALNNEVIGALHNIQSSNLASADGLVENNHPQYFSLAGNQPSNQSREWPIASQR